uniref:Protein S-acyltransferase n=1 Tax=Heterorhabditis bacteriophora TaxID=37862 RepID=A0A1I7WUV1_HETBA
MFAISLSCLFLYHLYLTARNRSTVESFRAPILESGPDKNAFNQGVASNYREVFGQDWTLWFLPVFSSLGDGVNFRRWSSVSRYSLLAQAETGGLLCSDSEDSLNSDTM